MANPKYFVWKYTTIVEVGSGCRRFAPDRFAETASKRVVMITDKGLVKAGVADQVKEVFDAHGKPLAGVYDDVDQDAGLMTINDCARWFRELAADGLLAVGGGSVMDAAKGVKTLIGLKETNFLDIITGNQGRMTKPLAKPLGIPHVAIPTTAGTGSEVSSGGVVYIEEKKIKLTVRHPYMCPDFALLDPDLTVSLPPKLTAETGFDALCHAIEGYFGPNANSMSDALALQVFRIINKQLPLAVQNGGNLDARTEMLIASNMAVMSLVLGGGAVPIHNFAHAIGAKLRVPHGQGNAVFMPAVMKNLFSFYRPKAELLAQSLGVYTAKMSPDEILTAAISEIVNLQKKCHINPVLPQALDAAGFEMMLNAVKSDNAARLFPIPDAVISACLKECFVIK